QGPTAGFGGGPSVAPVPKQVLEGIYGQRQSAPTFGGGRQGGMNFGGGGIAGVASKSEEAGIKLYNERSKYKEWEFLYDPRKDGTSPMGQQRGGMQGGIPGAPGSSTGTGSRSGGTGFGGGSGSNNNPLFTPSNPRK
ncbi:MAG TPA: hypothetical protein VN428_25585, partial [Bryobacteraceae bacterium]|nr:hypothetical protein [Bryobacteraceae bacterium]